jgi:farnesyl-diphosphate farnesyltransferase
MPELRSFYKHLYEKGWNVSGYGDNADERDLLERFHYVVDVFLDLKPAYAPRPSPKSSLSLSFFLCSMFVFSLTPMAAQSDASCSYQQVIADITRRMGEGMAKYAGEKTVVTLEDYNEYCHYVAGLVGIGLSQMFAASGLECTLPPCSTTPRQQPWWSLS